MKNFERMFTYNYRVQQLGSVLKSADDEINNKESAVSILSGLPTKYKNIITAQEGHGDDSERFFLEAVKRRLK